MRIAIVLNTSWNIWNFRKGLVEALLKEGHEVIAIAPEDEYSAKLIAMGCRYEPLSMQNKGSNPFSDLLLMRRLYQLYKSLQPQVILHYTIKPNIYGSIAARWAGIPCINNVSGLGTVFLHHNLVSWIARQLYKIAFRSPAKIFFQNRDDRDLFLKKKLVKPELTALVPGSGVNLDKFSVAPFKRNDPFVFLLVARVLYDKGIVEYIEAIRILKRQGLAARFLLVGAPDKTSALGIPISLIDQWVKEGLIEYHSFTDNILSFYQKADVVLLPSYREGTPKTLLEAAACGKPLIATDVPGCRDVVEEGINGYLCKVKDPASLAAVMQKALTLNGNALQEKGLQSRKKIEREYDEKLVIGIYLKAIKSIGK